MSSALTEHTSAFLHSPFLHLPARIHHQSTARQSAVKQQIGQTFAIVAWRIIRLEERVAVWINAVTHAATFDTLAGRCGTRRARYLLNRQQRVRKEHFFKTEFLIYEPGATLASAVQQPSLCG